MKLVRGIDELRKIVGDWRGERKLIGLVPTMGWFHDGHLSLMKMARSKADKVVVSLFVNPLQFGQGEDLSSYPRDLDRDMKLADEMGVDILFSPDPKEMYREGFQTNITVASLTRNLCGASRPGHFTGVATVVAKLFNIVQPDFAVFGEKDFQQLAVIRRMVKDLDFPIEILGHPIVREKDGLAMSSRNTYLNTEERQNALCLYKSIQYARERIRNADSRIAASSIVEEVKNIIDSTDGCAVDYVEVVDCDTLQASEYVDSRSVMLLAVKINGRVRLIDNSPLIEIR